MQTSFLFRATLLLIFLSLVVVGMIFGQAFLVPVCFAILLSLLLLPLSNAIEHIIHSKALSIIFSLLAFLIIISAASYSISTQVSNIISDYDFIEERLQIQIHNVQQVINAYTGINETQQEAWFDTKSEDLLKSGFEKAQDLLVGVGNFVFSLSLVLIYTFFLLMYRNRIKLAILSMADESQHAMILMILEKIKALILNYLTGLFIALTIIGAMNAIGLKILGIEHGIFLGFLAGFLNIIPYIGSFIGASLPIIMALIYKDSMWYAVGVFLIFMFNQFIDNNITTPSVVGGYVRINSLATIFAVIVGGMIWGVAGMILFIPMLGIFKIFCDNIETLKPLSIILSDDGEDQNSIFKKIFQFFKKKKITN